MALFGAELLPDPEAVIPTEFYDVRSETTPKAGWIPMYSFTAIIYISALVAFILLYQNEASKSTTETIILSYDNTGNDGYICQMISRVTSTYQIPSENDPSLAFSLANVMESKSTCQSDLLAADPCASPMTYFPGTAESLWSAGTSFRAAAMFSDNTVYVYDTSDETTTITLYDYVQGKYFDSKFYPVTPTITGSLAVNKLGNPIYLCKSSSNASVQVRQAAPADVVLAQYDYSSAGYTDAMVLNDNLYNIYVVLGNAFVSLNIYAQPVVSTVLFNATEGDTIQYATVYHDGTSPTVYFYTSVGAGTNTYYQYKDNFITAYEDTLYPAYGVTGMVTDGQYVYFSESTVSTQYTYYVMRFTPGDSYSSSTLISTLVSTVTPPAFAISPSGSRIFSVQQDAANVVAWTMVYLSGGYYAEAEPVLVMSGFGAEYFACGDQLLSSDDYSPGVEAEYAQACESNGLVGKVAYDKRDYILTATDTYTFALNGSASHCAALAAPICNTVSALPPYSCSRTLRQGFFSCAATAVANAQFLVQVLVFLCAFLLPKLAKVFPATARSVAEGTTGAAAAAVETAASAVAHAAQLTSTAAAGVHQMGASRPVNSTADAYIEMAAMGLPAGYDVENPLSSSNQ